MKGTLTILSAAAMLLSAGAAPFSYEGRWHRNGVPQTLADTTCTVRFYAEENAGDAAATSENVPFKTDSEGYFVVSADAPATLPDVYWVGVAPSGGDEISPRFRVAPVPFAIAAESVELVKTDSKLTVTGTATIDRLETTGDMEVDEWTIPSGGTVRMTDASFDSVKLTDLTMSDGAMLGLYNAKGGHATANYDRFSAEKELMAEVHVYSSGFIGFYLHADTRTESASWTFDRDGLLMIALWGNPMQNPAPKVSVSVGSTAIISEMKLGADKGGDTRRFMTVPYRANETVSVKLVATGSGEVDDWWGGDEASYRGKVGARLRLVRFGRD